MQKTMNPFQPAGQEWSRKQEVGAGIIELTHPGSVSVSLPPRDLLHSSYFGPSSWLPVGRILPQLVHRNTPDVSDL